MRTLTYIFITICFFVISSQSAEAQYGGGYGGGYGGMGGGYGRNRMSDPTVNFPQKKEEMDPEKMATEDTKWMTKKLKLTEEQIPKVEDININYAFKKMDMFEEAKKMLPPYTEEQRTKMRDKYNAMKAGKDKELKEVLTPEQYEIYLKKKQD
jgi:Spy/CpxP family protein refolding chaperone